MARNPFMLLLTILCLSSSLAAQDLRVTFSDTTTVTGVTPGGRLVAFIVGRKPLQYHHQRIVRDLILADSDGDGSVMIPGEVPQLATCVFSDLSTGRTVIVPRTVNGVEEQLPLEAFERNQEGKLHKLRHNQSDVLLLVVRPQFGAWKLYGTDGGYGDDDKNVPGRVSAKTTDFVPIGDSPAPPKHFSKKDTVVGIDPVTLRYFTREVLND